MCALGVFLARADIDGVMHLPEKMQLMVQFMMFGGEILESFCRWIKSETAVNMKKVQERWAPIFRSPFKL